MAVRIVIPDTSVLYPIETSFTDKQKDGNHPVYSAKDKIVDDITVLDVPPIFIKEDSTQSGYYICLDGNFRTSLATLFGIGIEALVFQNVDDMSQTLRRNFLFAHGIRAQQEGVQTFDNLAKKIDIYLVDAEMREKYRID